jgi:hypothetical protein
MAHAVALMSRKSVRHRIAAGHWQQPARSVVVTHSGPISAAERRWIALLTAGQEAMLAGISAAQAGALRGYDDDSIHIRRDATGRRRYLDAFMNSGASAGWHPGQ